MAQIEKLTDIYEIDVQYRKINIERMADLWATSFIEEYPEVLYIGLESIC